MKRNIFLFLIGVFLFPAQICHAEVKTIDVCDPSKFGTLCRVGHSPRGLLLIPSNSTLVGGYWMDWVDQACPAKDSVDNFTIYRKMHCEEKDKICEHYKLLFKPPANNCIFEIEKGVSCVDGEYNVIEYKFRIRDSQRRVSDWFTSQRSAENADVECEYKLIDVKNCNSEKGECFEPLDTGGCTYIKSDGTYDLKESCLKKVGKGGSSGGGSSGGGSSGGGSSGGGSSGGGSSGGGSSGGGSSGGGSSGGGSSGGGSSGGGSSGGGSSGGGSSGGGSSGGGSSGEGSSGGGSSGGGSSGGGSSGGGSSGGGSSGGGSSGGEGSSGGGSSGGGSGKDYGNQLGSILDKLNEIKDSINSGKDDGKDSYSGDGGMGTTEKIDGMEKGEKDLEGLVDKVFDGILNNDTMKAIRGHKYIQTSDARCSLSFDLWNNKYSISLCEYERELRLFGNIMFGIISIMGFLMVLRS